MTVLPSDVHEAVRAVNEPEAAAMEAAAASSRRDEVIGVEPELLVIRWMMGSVLGVQLVVREELSTP